MFFYLLLYSQLFSTLCCSGVLYTGEYKRHIFAQIMWYARCLAQKQGRVRNRALVYTPLINIVYYPRIKESEKGEIRRIEEQGAGLYTPLLANILMYRPSLL